MKRLLRQDFKVDAIVCYESLQLADGIIQLPRVGAAYLPFVARGGDRETPSPHQVGDQLAHVFVQIKFNEETVHWPLKSLFI